MTDKFDDSIIDACLEEVLGGSRPPDLTRRILRAWDNRTHDEVVLEESAVRVDVQDSKLGGRWHRGTSPWLAVATLLAIMVLGSAFVWTAWKSIESGADESHQLAEPDATPPPAHERSVPPPATVVEVPAEPTGASSDDRADPLSIPQRTLVADDPRPKHEQLPTTDVRIPDERPTPLADDQMVHAINELIRVGWQREGLMAAEPVSDEQWCRRVYLKLIGREPDARELNSFALRRTPRKRAELVDLLLQGEAHTEEFAAHWGRRWADILIASGNNRVDRDGLEQYLRRAFGEGKAWDETTHQLLTATGSGEIGSASYNGAANFLLAHADRNGVHAQATAHVSRTFMALSLECSQCHVDSTWSGVEPQQFWELNAFFRQLDVTRDREGTMLLVDVDRTRGESLGSDGETYYTTIEGLLRTAYPVFVDGTEIPKSPSVEQVNRRDLLAKFVTRSEQFRQAMANRFWSELFGVGFTIPADNIGPHNPPSRPELLAKLGGQFAAHDYDVRALIRWIVLSEPFALSAGDVATDDQIGGKLVFNCFPAFQEDGEPILRRLQTARQVYTRLSGRMGGSETTARVSPTTVPDAVATELSEIDTLLASVVPEARRMSRSTVYGNSVLGSSMSLEQKIQHMFFATLHRAPNASERKAVDAMLNSGGADADNTALEYIWWALASSREAR